ncbi:type 1 glutamine amidotransferase domain-containing protein [Derxia gummosa]|uniref:Type 1 glutamine amidotransferase domain-containing protein n=1 Tax=Derxia gummosa DSM 723 TaxID=1121388 RepID=A0A8B6X3X7_9BURK|nr:type 1 glutamine amidotransferase domain-containing protein [Derxia gummosa]
MQRFLASFALVAMLAGGPAFAAGKGRVLVLLSSETQLPLASGPAYATGYYLNEFGVPADRLLKAGYELVPVTPRGNAASVDGNSVTPQYFGGDAAEMRRIESVVAGLPAPRALDEVLAGDLDQYAGIFIPGGHAPLIDLANNPRVGRLLAHFHARAKPTAAICHGPIALLSAQDDARGYESALVAGRHPAAGHWLYAGYRMTIFSTPEEQVFEGSLDGRRIRYYPAAAMAGAGGAMDFAPVWQPHVVVDRELITGQNPFSDKALADAFIGHLEADAAR